MEDVCLYDFVANYDWYGRDVEGNRKYRKLTKPRLVNHYAYNPNKECLSAFRTKLQTC